MKPTEDQIIEWLAGAGSMEGALALAYEAGRADENEACEKTAMELLFVYIGSYPINEQFADAIRARREQ